MTASARQEERDCKESDDIYVRLPEIHFLLPLAGQDTD